jgi:SAM-dependent methyltransferase
MTTATARADLPVADGSFDAVLSVFGAMFTPDHQRAADEIIRAARPGGTVGLASWIPDGFVGRMFGVITQHVPGPPGVASPLLWGTEQHLSDLFGAAAADARSVQRTCTWRFTSPEAFAAFFRRWYGPALKAFEVLEEDGRAALAHLARQAAAGKDVLLDRPRAAPVPVVPASPDCAGDEHDQSYRPTKRERSCSLYGAPGGGSDDHHINGPGHHGVPGAGRCPAR